MQINAIGSASSKCVLQTAIILDKQQFLPVLVCGHGTKKTGQVHSTYLPGCHVARLDMIARLFKFMHL